jgi:hypothetical protein
MTKTITVTNKGVELGRLEVAPLTKDVLTRASKNLRREKSKKYIPGDMDFEETADFNAECIRIVLVSLTMADGTHPLLGKSEENTRRFLLADENEWVYRVAEREASKLAEASRLDYEVSSGN